MPKNYRSPTIEETRKLEASRKLMADGINGEKDMMSKLMPTMAKSARDDMTQAKRMREAVPAVAREGEAYNNAGYKKGGKVDKFARGGGIESKGKTDGKVVKMAKGGSARGYGISKVTNKTKYC
jgi:hypothetical protein